LLTAACSSDGGMVNSGQGQVRISLTSGDNVAPAGLAEPGNTSSESGSTVVPTDGDRDESGNTGDGSACDRLQAANVTFSAVLARNLDGQLIDTSMDLPRTLNMLRFADGGRVELPVGFLPPGMYDLIVVNITKVEFVLLNGLKITIEPPLGGWITRLDVRPRPFEVIEGQTTTVGIRFYPHRLFRVKDGKFKFDIDGGFEMGD
jgi:hypothetical protein